MSSLATTLLLPEGPEIERIWRFRVSMDAEGFNLVVARQTDGLLVLSAGSSDIVANARLAAVVAPLLRPGHLVATVNLAPDEWRVVEQCAAATAASARAY